MKSENYLLGSVNLRWSREFLRTKQWLYFVVHPTMRGASLYKYVSGRVHYPYLDQDLFAIESSKLDYPKGPGGNDDSQSRTWCRVEQ